MHLAVNTTAGLLYVLSKIKDPSLTDDTLNTWYNTVHIKDIIASGLSDLAIRYRNVNTTAKWPYLAIYRLPNVSKLNDKNVTASIPATNALLPNGKKYTDLLELDQRPFVVVQKFEGQIAKDGPRGKAIRTALIEPVAGGDAEFDEWYRKQHLDMLSMVPGYRRSTRYSLLPGAAAGKPRFLALHDFDDTNFSGDIRLALGTQWSKKVLGGAKAFESDAWSEVAAVGVVNEKL